MQLHLAGYRIHRIAAAARPLLRNLAAEESIIRNSQHGQVGNRGALLVQRNRLEFSLQIGHVVCAQVDIVAAEPYGPEVTRQPAVLNVTRLRMSAGNKKINHGDYAAGPSHVLPTGGTARFASGLSANDFLRRSSVLSFSPEGLAHLVDDVRALAHREGLTAHAASIDVRTHHKDPTARR